jgi:hypothetical protein
MCHKRNWLLISLFLLLNLSVAYAAPIKEHLNEEDISRLKALKETFLEVEKKTPQQLVLELEKTNYPKINLAIKEAMAKAYLDIIKEQGVQGEHKKEWLYSMIALNMAYFQFGGDKDSAGGTKNLNKLIRYKLKTYLPVNIFKQPGFHCNIG